MNYRIFFCILLFSCGEGSLTHTVTQDSLVGDSIQEDTIHHQKDSLNTYVNTRLPKGVYQTVLPCSDCKSIQHTILFNPDLSYRLEEINFGKEETATKTEGHWKPTNGIIWLYKDQILKARYTWKGDTLQYIDPKTENRYSLYPLNSILNNDIWRNKKKEGVAFFGIGNEPFWSIEVNEQKGIAFHLAEWNKPLQLKPAQPVLSRDSVIYNTSNDSTTLRIIIYNTFCSDGMSDHIYNNKVKVLYNGQAYSGCGLLFK